MDKKSHRLYNQDIYERAQKVEKLLYTCSKGHEAVI